MCSLIVGFCCFVFTLINYCDSIRKRYIGHDLKVIKEKDIFCLPFTTGKTIPIPRKEKRSLLAQTGLNAKVSFSMETTKEEIAKILQDKFGKYFEKPFEYTFLSTMNSKKSKRLHRAETIYPHFKPHGRHLMMIATHGNIYIMAQSDLKSGVFTKILQTQAFQQHDHTMHG